MREFIARHAEKITGVLTGFDRVLFRGMLLGLNHEGGLRCFLAQQGVLTITKIRGISIMTCAARLA